MKKLVVIGANNFQLPLIRKARQLGLETHVFAWEKGAIGKLFADHFYPISIDEKDLILEEVKRIDPTGIVSVASDLAIITVNYIAEKLKLVGNSHECTRVTTNKYAMRECLSGGGLPCPKYSTSANVKDILSHCGDFPLIVKPLDRSGSRGVTQVMSRSELEAAISRASAQSFIPGYIVEQFISGREYSVEMISWKGEHHFLQITEKETSGSPYFVEKAHHQPAELPPAMKEKILAILIKALTCLGIEYGASHSEVMLTREGDIYIVEIGARMGGDYIGSHLVELSTGYDFLKGVIDIACGKFVGVNLSRTGYSGIHYIFAEPGRLNRIINRSQEYSDIVFSEVYYRIGDEVREVLESNDRAACYVYRSTSGKISRHEGVIVLESSRVHPCDALVVSGKHPQIEEEAKEWSSRKRILILGAGIFQLPLIRKARARGYETLVTSVVGRYPGIDLADRFFATDITDTEGILALAREQRISAIVTSGTDACIPTIGAVVDQLGFNGPSQELAETVSWKTYFRDFLHAHGLNCPEYASCLTPSQARGFYRQLGKKTVFKPDDASGSRGVTILNAGLKEVDVDRAYQNALENSRNGRVCVEEFIRGKEVGGDAFFLDGDLLYFTTTHKHLEGVLVRGHTLPGDLSPEDSLRVRNEIAIVAERLGYRSGPMNFDVIVNDEGAYILELGLRNGGNGIVELVQHSENVDLVEWTLDHALGIPIRDNGRAAASPVSSYVFGADRPGILRSITDLATLQRQVPQVFEMVLAKNPGDEVEPLIHNANLVGYLLLRCGSADYDKLSEEIRVRLRVEVE